MRAAILGLATSLLAGNALAADYLRGSNYEPAAPGYHWTGVYIGGQVGYSEANATFGATASTIPQVGATWMQLPGASAHGITYGGFVGYNAQWGDVVLGVEGNYNHMSLRAVSAGVVSGTDTYGGFGRLTDVMTFRGRAGYAMGWLMPYAFVGLAIGRLDTERSATIPPDTYVQRHNGNYSIGFAAGGGVDMGLTQNLFLRAEYEFVHLTNVRGVTAITNTVRGGAGLKF